MYTTARSLRKAKFEAKVVEVRSPLSAGACTILQHDLTIIGEIETDGEVEIGGRVEGRINAQSVTVLPGGEVEGTILADTASICGTVKGEIKASTVSVGKTAQVVGKIFHSLLNIEPGALLEGVRPWRPQIDRPRLTGDSRSVPGKGS